MFQSVRCGSTVRRAVRGLLALSALVLLAACEDTSSGNPVSPTPAPPPAPRLLQQGTFDLKAPTNELVNFVLTTVTDAAFGRWEGTVDWGSEANTLWMWVADGACSAEQFARPDCPDEATCPCRFAIRSETASPKPRVLSIASASGGTRTLIIANLGPREERGQYRVTLTAASGAADRNQTSSATGDGGAHVLTGLKSGLTRR